MESKELGNALNASNEELLRARECLFEMSKMQKENPNQELMNFSTNIQHFKERINWIEVLSSLARQHLAVIEKGVPEKIGICGTVNIFDEKKMLGWNACHDAFLPLLVEKEKEIARLSKEVNDLDHGLHKHQDPHWKMWERVLAEKEREVEDLKNHHERLHDQYDSLRTDFLTTHKKMTDLESQLSSKMTRERVVEIIWDTWTDQELNTRKVSELADAIIAKWGGENEIVA